MEKRKASTDAKIIMSKKQKLHDKKKAKKSSVQQSNNEAQQNNEQLSGNESVEELHEMRYVYILIKPLFLL